MQSSTYVVYTKPSFNNKVYLETQFADQNLDWQIDALKQYWCEDIFLEKFTVTSKEQTFGANVGGTPIKVTGKFWSKNDPVPELYSTFYKETPGRCLFFVWQEGRQGYEAHPIDPMAKIGRLFLRLEKIVET